MKVLIVNGSSHVNGTTMQAIQEVQKVFSEAMANVYLRMMM